MSTEHALLYNEAPIIGQGIAKLKNTDTYSLPCKPNEENPCAFVPQLLHL